MKHKTLFVFDLETIIDLKAARNLLGENIPEDTLKESFIKYHLDISGGKSNFIRQLFHQIVAISFIEAEIHKDDEGGEYYIIKDIRSGGNEKSNEIDLVQGFFNYLAPLKARLVSFNGRTFDLPVLKYRAMLHEIQAKWLYQSGDKWNNYMNRYSNDWHCDLLEVLSDYGVSARIKISEVCALLGLPGKIDVDGSQVEELYYQGKIKEIRDYCELDVINTYLIYLKYMFHIGSLNKEHYYKCLEDLTSLLQSQAKYKKNFTMFLDEWSTKYQAVYESV